MTDCDVCSGHHPHIATSRRAAVVRCDCGWEHHTLDVAAASVAWANHIATNR